MRKTTNRLLIFEEKSDRRKLIKVPILHTKEDMGSLGNRLVAINGYHAVAYDYWGEIMSKIKSLPYDCKKIKVYQDGLPDTKGDLVRKIVDEGKSPNYELLRWLKSQGATIVGTENPNLIKEEYYCLKAIFEAKNGEEKLEARKRYQERTDALLSLRDAYITQRIDTTLKKGELGILFLGMAHKIDNFLPKTLLIEQL